MPQLSLAPVSQVAAKACWLNVCRHWLSPRNALPDLIYGFCLLTHGCCVRVEVTDAMYLKFEICLRQLQLGSPMQRRWFWLLVLLLSPCGYILTYTHCTLTCTSHNLYMTLGGVSGESFATKLHHSCDLHVMYVGLTFDQQHDLSWFLQLVDHILQRICSNDFGALCFIVQEVFHLSKQNQTSISYSSINHMASLDIQ